MRIELCQVPFDSKLWETTHYPKIIQQVYANRGITSPEMIERALDQLLSPNLLGNIDQAATLLADAIEQQRYITISGDYDCDGATGTSVGVLGFRMLGLSKDRVQFVIPNRERHGYGLSVGLVDELPVKTDIVVTVDSGVASIEGIAHAKSKGYIVVVTDHHLPGDILPNADVIVNPNLKGDPFPSKALAGVGVMFYVLAATRAELKRRQHPGGQADLRQLLDLVTIGTVADLVPLDQNNRILVTAGLRQIHFGKASVGLTALLSLLQKDIEYFTSTDISFAIAPRINSAGRLADMSLGVQLLTCEDPIEALRLVRVLEDINQERKEVQAEMQLTAETIVELAPSTDDLGVVVFDPSWHHGIVGLIASKLKENLFRPTVAFAPAGPDSNELRGSARSIPGLHLRDVLALIDTRYPGVLLKFGGHAMAAGMSIHRDQIDTFKNAFNTVLAEQLTKEMLEHTLRTDGELQPEEMTVEFTKYLEACGPWGQGFSKPIFQGTFEIKEVKVLKDKHLKFELYDVRNGDVYDALWFFGNRGGKLPQRFTAAYELSLNVYRGRETCQLLIRHIEMHPDVTIFGE